MPPRATPVLRFVDAATALCMTSQTVAGPADTSAMTQFAAKTLPDADKLRGGYYTPDGMARFIAEWVGQAGPCLLEPSCGDGAILKHLAVISPQATGIELVAEEAAKARQYATVHESDLFAWLDRRADERWDGVAGNPPYIRFGNWPEALREPALRLLQDAGLKPSKLTNAWVPFVVAATRATRDGGRVGLVLPAELLQVGYAAQLRQYLVEHYTELTVVTFRRLVFEGILQEVVLLLGVRGPGPAHIRTCHLDDIACLATAALAGPAAPALRHDHEKWTKYFLKPSQIDALWQARTSGGLTLLSKWAEVDVGIVTGRNSFFTMTGLEADTRGIRDLCIPLVARSVQIPGLVYEEEAFREQEANGTRCLLLNADATHSGHHSLAAYVQDGEAASVHTGYKCSIRTPWWRTPSVWTPDAFMLRQIHTHPKIVINESQATTTDTVHRVRVRPGTDVRQLTAAYFNSATFAFCEVMGRNYGGGIHELEPREAEALPMPAPALADPDLITDLDRLIRVGKIEKALDIADQVVLIDGLGWTRDQVLLVRSAWTDLSARRNKRGQRTAAA